MIWRNRMKKNRLCIAFFVAVSLGFFGCVSNPYTNQLAELDSDEARDTIYWYNREIAWYKQNGRLLTDTRRGQQVVQVGNNLIDAAKKWERVNNRGKLFAFWHRDTWEINYVEEPVWNAWCMAGGKICVFSGIFDGPDAIQSDDDLAAILGHEIAHALLFHTKRKKDNAEYSSGVRLGDDTKNAYSRAMETEADKLGLTLMVIAGYDGNAAIQNEERWASINKGGNEYLSTHPASWRRAKNLRKELPKSQKIARKINQGKKAVQFIAPTLSVSAGMDAGVSPVQLFNRDAPGFFYGAGPKVSLENNIYSVGFLGLAFSMPNGMENWLGSAYAKFSFRFGASAETILSPLYGIEFSKGYFGNIMGANIDIKLIDRLYLRGEAAFRWQWSASGSDSDFPPLILGLGAVWAIK